MASPTCFRLVRGTEHCAEGSLYCRTYVNPPEPWVPIHDPSLLEEIPAPDGVPCASCDDDLVQTDSSAA